MYHNVFKEKLFENKYTYGYKRVIKADATEHFNQALYASDWVEIETCDSPFEFYKLSFEKFLIIHKDFFQKKKIKIKAKAETPWLTSGIKKSSKHKLNLYEKFLKIGNQKSELKYKTYKNLFGTKKTFKEATLFKIDY